jgi:hypothetical protein
MIRSEYDELKFKLLLQMIRFISLNLVTAFMLIVGGCGFSQNLQILKPEYVNNRQFNATLLVMPLTSEILDVNQVAASSGQKAASTKYFDRQELIYFYNYMGPSMSEITTANVLGIDPVNLVKNISFSRQNVNGDTKQPLYMHVPTTGPIRYMDREPDYILFFEEIYFKKDFIDERTGIGRGSSSNYSMQAGLMYLIWDNKKGNIAAFGKLERLMNLLDYPKKSNYISIFEEFAALIIDKSPLVRKQVQL